MNETYGSGEIQRIAKISRIQAVHWTEQGAVIPAQDARGRGKRRVYDWQNLIEFMICRELNRFTIETHIMTAVLIFLRKAFELDYRVYIPREEYQGYDIVERGSYWSFLKREPDTDVTVLYAFPTVYHGKECWASGVLNSDTFGMAAITANTDYASIIGIDIRKLIAEADG